MPIKHILSSKNEVDARAEMERIGGSNMYYLEDDKLWMCHTHVGLCIMDYERNGYDDSDFYMIVWNPETKQTETIMFATTRGWSYPCYSSSPDLDEKYIPEVKEYIYKHAKEDRTYYFEKKAKEVEVGKGENSPDAVAYNLCRDILLQTEDFLFEASMIHNKFSN